MIKELGVVLPKRRHRHTIKGALITMHQAYIAGKISQIGGKTCHSYTGVALRNKSVLPTDNIILLGPGLSSRLVQHSFIVRGNTDEVIYDYYGGPWFGKRLEHVEGKRISFKNGIYEFWFYPNPVEFPDKKLYQKAVEVMRLHVKDIIDA